MTFDEVLDTEIALVPVQKSREELEAEGYIFSSTCANCKKLYPTRTGTDAQLWGADMCDDCRQTNMPW